MGLNPDVFSDFQIDTSTVNIYLQPPTSSHFTVTMFKSLLTDCYEKLSKKCKRQTKRNTQIMIKTTVMIGTSQLFIRMRNDEYKTTSDHQRGNFKNCLTFAFTWGGRNRSIKYFNTGNMTLNGCKSMHVSVHLLVCPCDWFAGHPFAANRIRLPPHRRPVTSRPPSWTRWHAP